MRAVCSLVVCLLGVLGACTRPSPMVMCHNANCAKNDVTRDDSLDALDESLALSFHGAPVIDGVEWDTFWYGAENRCIFAHDLNNNTSVPVSDAADKIANYLATNTVVSANGERFYTMIELKGFVGNSYSDRHSDQQFLDHAACALDAAKRIADGAAAGGHPLTIGFVADVARHLYTVSHQDAFAELKARPDVELMLIGDIFMPYSSLTAELTDFKDVKLSGVEYHPDYMTVEKRNTYESLDIQLAQWSFISTEEAFDAITRWEPEYVISNEAVLMRRWIEN